MIGGLILFLGLIILLLIRTPIFLALIFSGSIAFIISFGFSSWWHWISFSPWSLFSKYHYSVIPLFLLMGQIASNGNITKELFIFAANFGRKHRGSIAISTIISCGIFGSLCGSSLATAATMTKISYNEMYKRNYSQEIIFGTLAAGGTLGILIPPSIVLVIYAMIAEESIAHLSLAAMIPAIIALLGYIAAIKFYAHKHPKEVPNILRTKKFLNKKEILVPITIFILFVIMLSGLYTGKFSPTEAASVGVVGVICIVILAGNWKYLNWNQIFVETAQTTAIIMAIFIGAELFNTALNIMHFPEELCDLILLFKDYPKMIMFVIIVSLILLGCFMDGIAIVLLVVPLLIPIITNIDLGINPKNVSVWFGIIILMVVEIGLITPPVGMNLFVIRSVEPKLKKVNILKAIKYFLITDLIRILILVIFPSIMILPY